MIFLKYNSLTAESRKGGYCHARFSDGNNGNNQRLKEANFLCRPTGDTNVDLELDDVENKRWACLANDVVRIVRYDGITKVINLECR